MAKFRLTTGIHSEGGRTYKPGDIIDSMSNLAKHNIRGDMPRFVLVEGNPVSRPLGDPTSVDFLEGMTIQELRQYAAEEEIDLQDATKKAEIIRICQEVQPTVA